MADREITGLTSAEVQDRILAGKQNLITNESSRTVKDIVLSNIFTFFNLINVILFALVFSVFSLKNMTFMFVVIINTVIGIFQEIRAKKTLDNLRILTIQEVEVVREGKKMMVKVDELVQDDVIILRQGQQIPADGDVILGSMEVNESLLTGEADSIPKSEGSRILSGSFVTAGKAVCRLTQVGNDSYMEQISRRAKEQRKHNSELRNSIDRILKIVSILIFPVGVGMFCKEYFLMETPYSQAVLDTVAAVVGMIPEGLVLLTSIALALGVIRLAQKKTLIQELYGIETLARVDMLCLDKTGTLTEGRLKLEKMETIEPETDVTGILQRMMKVLSDDNETAKAIREAICADGAEERPMVGRLRYTIPFSSERKYSGMVLEGAGSFYTGAYSFLFPEQERDPEIMKKISDYAMDGYRVLVLAKSEELFTEKEKPHSLKLLAILLITDVIRPEAPEILRYFREQGVEVRVISGDDAVTVAAIARRCGLSEVRPIDASYLKTDEQLKEAMAEGNVFGRVTPQQKEKMVEILRGMEHVVAMTGDGVNDVLALKKADCSIAMASGSDAAKNVANVVLLNSDFSAMPRIVNEGRRVINNIQMASSMFLVKTVFSILLAIMTIFFGQAYPFEPVQLSIISAFAVGIPSFLLQLEPSFQKIRRGFIWTVLENAVPTAFTIATFVFLMQNIGMSLGYTSEQMATACVLTTGFNYVIAQKRVYTPMTNYRGLVIYSMQILFLATIIVLGRCFLDLTDLPLEIVAIILMAVQLSVLLTHGYSILFARFEKHVLSWQEKRKEKKTAKAV